MNDNEEVTDVELQPQEAANEPKADEEAAVVDVADQSTLSYVGIFFSAIVLLVALTWSKEGESGHKGDKYYNYGISIAVVAMFFALVGFGMARYGLVADERIAMYNNYFLFVWNFIGACFMTFGGPFKTTGNGYFGSWMPAATRPCGWRRTCAGRARTTCWRGGATRSSGPWPTWASGASRSTPRRPTASTRR